MTARPLRKARAIIAITLAAAACTADDGQRSQTYGPVNTEAIAESDVVENSDGSRPPAPSNEQEPLPVVSFTVRRSFGQLTVLDGEPGTAVIALPSSVDIADSTSEVDAPLASSIVSTAGSAILRRLEPGDVQLAVVSGGEVVADGGTVNVPAADPPAASVYRTQQLGDGFGYIETRDGTTLSAFVTHPTGGGPFPTLIEYSPHELSNPDAADDPARLLLPQLGFALVQVNVRGSGCSGGSFDAFAPLQAVDGYDVIETIAAQDWSDGIGMWGLGDAATLQLFVAATQPPSLSAIGPLSPLGSVDEALLPGGLLNTGLAERWTGAFTGQAQPFGTSWVRERANDGDAICKANQALRVHSTDIVELLVSDAEERRRRSATTTAGAIGVPVFLAGTWQDEVHGGGSAAILTSLPRTTAVRATFHNGLHVDPLGTEVMKPLIEFYDLFVGKRARVLGPLERALLAVFSAFRFGAAPAVPDAGRIISFEAAKEAFERADPITVLFDVGAPAANLPVSSFAASFASWPPEESNTEQWFLGRSQTLTRDSSSVETSISFQSNPGSGSVVTAPDLNRLWTSSPNWNWAVEPDANRAVFTGPVTSEEVVLLGSASVKLFVAVDADDATGQGDTELEVTLSEIAPDGSETFIQTGHVAMAEPVGVTTSITVDLQPMAHVLRPGSRIRLTIDSPGGAHAVWRFATTTDRQQVQIGLGGETSSALTLPVLTGLDAPDDRPTCGTLRGQPCRP